MCRSRTWRRVTSAAPAKVTFRALPGEVFEGRVTFVLHELDMATRTAKVRIEVNNPDHRIKHEMYADVGIDAGAGEAARLVVPSSAVIDSGTRQVVIVDRGRRTVRAAAGEARHARRRARSRSSTA